MQANLVDERLCELEKLCLAGGESNPGALRRVSTLLAQLRPHSQRTAWTSRLDSIENFSAVLYSQRKHDRYSGAATVRSLLLQQVLLLKGLAAR